MADLTKAAKLALLVLLAPLIFGCVSSETDTGVENLWRSSSIEFVDGRTTQRDVLTALGPPSQVIALGSRTVFYYLKEKTVGKQRYFLVYNTDRETRTFDRAIFFFDRSGRLLSHAYSKEALPITREARKAGK